MNSDIFKQYSTKNEVCSHQISRFEKLINLWSAYRLAALLGGIAVFYYSLQFSSFWLPIIVVFTTIFGFSLLVSKQNHFERRRNYFRNLQKVLTNELKSFDRNNTLYEDGNKYNDDSHAYTSDLDIFGGSSLFQWLNRCATDLGNGILSTWLKQPSAVTEIHRRQSALNELAKAWEWKHDFQVLLLKGEQPEKIDDLLVYMNDGFPSPGRYIKIYIAWAPWLFFLSAILGGVYPLLFLLTMALGIKNLIIVQSFQTLVLKSDQQTSKLRTALQSSAEAIESFCSNDWKSELCNEIKLELTDPAQGNLPNQLKQLSLIINKLNLGLSSLGPVLNLLMAWNVRYLFEIENWKKVNQGTLQTALEKLGQIEALISLSSINTNYPMWAVPLVKDEEHYTLEAAGIAHPLLSPDNRVPNDYSLVSTRHIDIITGSNMAGKSTFLRTIGVNSVLALCGASVCAEEMRISPFKLFSYMRIRDSLSENTSTFKAELNRLQELLTLMDSDEKLFFLIDEMLRGTNSIDKYHGSKAVIEKLIKQKGNGLIATHDLQISELQTSYPEYVRNYHFDITMRNKEMVFDYKLKSGPCTTFNAKTLLRSLGIEL